MTVRNRFDNLQETPERQTRNEEYEKLLTAHSAATEGIPTKLRAKCRGPWELIAVREKRDDRKMHPYFINEIKQMAGHRNFKKTREQTKSCLKDHHHHYPHHVAPTARISLTLSRTLLYRPSLPVGLQGNIRIGTELLYVGYCLSSCLCSSMWRGPQEYVTYEFVSTSPACLVRLTWIVFVMGGRWPISCCFESAASRTCSILLAAFLCSCHQAFSSYI